MSSPPKYPSTLHWPWSETVQRDDSILEDTSVFLGRRVVVTEKLDGGNTCLYQGQVFARSVSSPAVHGSFAMVKKHHSWKLAHRMDWGYAIYGEDIYGVHSIEYGPVKEDETYRVFAVRDLSMSRDYFVSWDVVQDMAKRYNMLTVPVIFRGIFNSVDDITTFFCTEIAKESALGGPREGFVMRLEDGFEADVFQHSVCKYVRPNHVQTSEHWRRNWKPCQTI